MESPSAITPAGRSLSLLRWIQYLIVAAMFVLGVWIYPKLPEIIPTHWGFTGQPDQWSPKIYGTWLLPGLALILSIFFPVLSRIDPKKENYASFKHTFDVIQLAIVAFMGYTFVIQLIATLNPGQSSMVGRYIVFGVGALFILIGNYMGKIRQNFFVGLRTPWSLSDPEVWGRSQRFGGWCFVIGGIVMMAEALFWIAVPIAFFAVLAFIVILPVVYSYLIYRKKIISRPSAP